MYVVYKTVMNREDHEDMQRTRKYMINALSSYPRVFAVQMFYFFKDESKSFFRQLQTSPMKNNTRYLKNNLMPVNAIQMVLDINTHRK